MPAYNDAVAELFQQLETGLRNYMQGNEYTTYLNVMSKFHEYSYRNCVLIAMQKPDASRVAGYRSWQKLNRQVRRGEKALRIIAPMPVKTKEEKPVIDEETGDPLKNPDDTPASKENAEVFMRYRAVSVFDISQTDGEPLPEINIQDLKDPVANFDKYVRAITTISSAPIRFSDISESSTAKGYYDSAKKEIVIRKGMPEAQTLKTMIHELTHSRLHDRDTGGKLTPQKTREVEAESTAYVVCRHFGLDTGDYTFPYIAAWSDETDLATLNDSMTTIQKTASSIISEVTEELDIERRENLKETMKAAGYEYDAEHSDSLNISFICDNGAEVQMESWDEVQAYVNTVILDASDVSAEVKDVADNEAGLPDKNSNKDIEKAKAAIKENYGSDSPDFSDLRHVDIAFTLTDEAKQYTADLISNRVNIYDVRDYLDYNLQNKDEPADKYGRLIESRQYDSVDDLINRGLSDVNKEAAEQVHNTDKDAKREIGSTVYVPVYDGEWQVRTIQLDDAKFWGKNDIVYNGVIYGREAYATEQGAWDYINRTNGDGFNDRVEFDPDTHEPYFAADKYNEQKEAREQRAGKTTHAKQAERKHGGPTL